MDRNPDCVCVTNLPSLAQKRFGGGGGDGSTGESDPFPFY